MSDAAVQSAPRVSAGVDAADTFEALYRRTFPRVYAYVASLVRDRAAAEDVTSQAFERAYRKRRSFRSARDTRGLRAELAETGDESERDALRRQIGFVRAEQRAAEGDVERLRERTSFATVTIELETAEDDGSAVGAALEDALDTLGGALGVAIRAAAILLPLALVGAAALMAGRAVRRRRRESALA